MVTFLINYVPNKPPMPPNLNLNSKYLKSKQIQNANYQNTKQMLATDNRSCLVIWSFCQNGILVGVGRIYKCFSGNRLCFFGDVGTAVAHSKGRRKI